ncbi:hypothetical protein [Luteococcus peritonei]|uniref:Uncharacterized protein n=1 Tax=Luteococcus peritonei TaxID=88874 RepID=A0ABW4RUG0_9ACTN
MTSILHGSAMPLRRALALTTSTLAVGALLAPLTPAQAAGTSTGFTMDAPQLTSTHRGQRLALRVTPAGRSTLQCSTVKLQARGDGGAWTDIATDWQASGCWSGGVNLVTTVTSSLVGRQVRLVGTLNDVERAPAGSSTLGQSTSTRQVDLPGMAESLPSGFTWSATAAHLPAGSGQRLALRVTPVAGATLDCTGLVLQRGTAQGSWVDVDINWQASGCWKGGAEVVATTSAQMAGQPLRLTGRANRTGSEAPRLAATLDLPGAGREVVVALSASTSTPAPTEPPATTAPSAQPTPEVPAPGGPGTGQPAPGGQVTSLSLPRIPWEGGAGYYAKFPDAVRGGWNDPKHFPISVWWGGGSTDAELQADKKMGINTYIVTNDQMDAKLFSRNKMSYIGHGTRTMDRDDPAWVGDYLDDEVDGRFSATEGLALMRKLTSKLPDHDKIRYANYTGMVISWHGGNRAWDAAARSYANDFTDTTSLDTYWFSSNQCDWANPNGHAYATPFSKASCRTGQNYGRSVKSLRWRDAQDGKLTPVWNFIENVDVTVDGTSHYALKPADVKAAAMSSIINEARGLVWFNQSFGGKCSTGNALRAGQQAGYACRDTVQAMSEVNTLIQSLAPVLNTQSYEWDFGKDLETMLKVHDGSAYVFAMSTDDAAAGRRSFTLHAELKGRTIEVVGEQRTITPQADGSFVDSFVSINDYHVYKIG